MPEFDEARDHRVDLRLGGAASLTATMTLYLRLS